MGTRFHRLLLLITINCFGALSAAGQPRHQPEQIVPRWGVAEFSITYDVPTENPFTEVEAVAEFISPEGAGTARVDGFFDGGGVWRFRYSPSVHGHWLAILELRHKGRQAVREEKAFLCKGDRNHGFLRRSPLNPYRLQYEDGTPFYPLGTQVCGHDRAGLDGPPRGEGEWRTVDMATYLQTFEGAANLFRIQLGVGTRAGCAREIMTDELGLYRYDLEVCKALDKTFSLLDRHGFSTMLIPFQDMSLWSDDSTTFGDIKDLAGWKNINNEEAVEPVRHYLRYLVARYAAYTDVWELFNEDVYTPDEWLRAMADYVKRLDPYGHLVTTNYERPLETWNDLVVPHEYLAIPAWEVDHHLSKELARLKSFGKPVLYTEYGNKALMSNRDPVKWRVAVWTAFMNESGLVFWGMGGIITPNAPKEPRGNSNAYLGPETREYFRHHLSFVRSLPLDLRPIMLGYGGGQDRISRYALSNGKTTVLYLHHNSGHDSPTTCGMYLWTGTGNFQIKWYDTEKGVFCGSEKVRTESNTLRFKSPEFSSDLAALIVRIEDAQLNLN
jgi:hypothetical protein